jgi:hypothetical protein
MFPECRLLVDVRIWTELMLMSAETELANAAWYYPDTKEKANNIKNYIAFCKQDRLLYLLGYYLS